MADPFVGRVFGKYEILRKIGQGGMGVVYQAHQTTLKRVVAIKILPRQMALDEDFVRRFRQEGEVIAGLDHEHIVRVHDVDSIDGLYCIVMELVEGRSLRQLLRQRRLGAEEVRAFGIPVARALDYAHRRGIVHRDVKSTNVMFTPDGRVKLMDFGIAKAAGSGIKTMTGAVLGTPEYMAPEQARSGRATVQTDVYSLGVLLYELATGRVPFTAEDPFAIALKHVSEPPVPPREIEPSIPEWLEATILKAMAKDPAERHPSAAAVEIELLSAGTRPDLDATIGNLDPLEATRVSAVRRPAQEVPARDPGLTTAPTIPRSAGLDIATSSSRFLPRRRLRWLLAGVVALALMLVVAIVWVRDSATPLSSAEPTSESAVSQEQVEAWLIAARAALEEGKPRDALREVSRALAAAPETPGVWELRERAVRELETARFSARLAEVEPPPVGGSGATRSAPTSGQAPVSAEPAKAPKSAEDLWREALELRSDGSFDSLKLKLGEVLAADPAYPEAGEWAAEVDGWIDDHRDAMWKLVKDQLGSLEDAFRDRDLERLAYLYGSRSLDRAALERYQELWSSYPVARLRLELQEIRVRDRRVEFEATVELDVKDRKGLGGWKAYGRQGWNGELVDDWGWAHFKEPFLPTIERGGEEVD